MNRRGFLGAILASAVAPAIVRASSLMPARVVEIKALESWSFPIVIDQMRAAPPGWAEAARDVWAQAFDNLFMQHALASVYDKSLLIPIQSRNFVRLDGALS